MSKYSIIIISVLCLLQVGCSLAPGGARLAHYAFDSKDYKKSLRLANRALTKYEYSIEDKTNLLFLKANSYAKLGEYANAEGAFNYLIHNYPSTEAAFRAKALLPSIINKKAIINKPITSDYSSSNSKTAFRGEIKWPVVMIEQKYPEKAAKYQIEGSVKLTFDISRKGAVINIRIIESDSDVFIYEAKRALSKWRYKPVIKNNKTIVSKDHIVILGFEMKDKRPNFTMEIIS